mmetsp:Transcript_2503/g.6731  ORF Transcript_2503/g.6731 Transcript_2503/m.6731 type:complete len:250 (-) Transcript_2503:231-980(-)
MPITQGVFLSMHPRGKKLISPNGHTAVASADLLSLRVWIPPRTSWSVGVGDASLRDTPTLLIMFRYLWISGSSSPQLRVLAPCSISAMSRVGAWSNPAVSSSACCIVIQLELLLPHSRLNASKTLGALRSLRLVSPSSITVDMKHSEPPAGCIRSRSAGNAVSFRMNSTSPTRTSFHVTHSNESLAPFLPFTRRCTVWEFSALSSRRRRRSSYMSLHAVHSSTRKNGPSLLCHVFGDHGKTTITQMKRK